jgi:RNA polymerase sigma-70 factor (ECF subfamily)
MQDEIVWIENVKKGKIQDFGFLVERYAKLSFSVAYNVVKDYDDANDIIQESMMLAYENIQKFNMDSKFSTWLYRIVFNHALRFSKKKKFFGEIENVSVPDNIEVEEEDLWFNETNYDKLSEAMARLKDNERFIIELYYYHNQSVKEISGVCTLSESNVKVLLYRSRQKLANLLLKINKNRIVNI